LSSIKKSEILGHCGKAVATGGHSPNLVKLQIPLTGPGSVIYTFCTGCGNYHELDQKSAAEYAVLAGTELPNNVLSWYFQTALCDCCDGTDPSISLESIGTK